MEMWNFEHYRDYYDELVAEYGEETGSEMFTETYDGMTWTNLPAKHVTDTVKKNKFAKKYIDIEWDTKEL